jgi:hypothetical protein
MSMEQKKQEDLKVLSEGQELEMKPVCTCVTGVTRLT